MSSVAGACHPELTVDSVSPPSRGAASEGILRLLVSEGW